ncbi:hypothetical protein GZH46_02372, partial [Fragariocoptes setiger]
TIRFIKTFERQRIFSPAAGRNRIPSLKRKRAPRDSRASFEPVPSHIHSGSLLIGFAPAICVIITYHQQQIRSSFLNIKILTLNSGKISRILSWIFGDSTITEEMAEQAKQSVDSTLASKPVVIFSKTYCPYCVKAIDLFTKTYSLGEDKLTIIQLENRSDCAAIQEYLKQITGASSVPRVFIKGKCIGGCDDTQHEEKTESEKYRYKMISYYMEYIKSFVTSIFHGGSRPNVVAAQHAIANVLEYEHSTSMPHRNVDLHDTYQDQEPNNSNDEDGVVSPIKSLAEYDDYEDYVPTDLRLVIVLSGKRKSGKDHISTMITNYIGYDHMNQLAVLRIAGPIKSQFAKSHNLDFDRLLGSSEYKENYRLSMVEWSEKYREKTGWHCFLVQAIREQHAKHKRIWFLTDARRPCDMEFFEQDPVFQNVRLLKIRITATDSIRASRGWIFDERVDRAPTECGLDTYKGWTHIHSHLQKVYSYLIMAPSTATTSSQRMTLAPFRKIRDFISSPSNYTLPATNLTRLNYRVACNLLYYQTNYFLVSVMIFLIFLIFMFRTLLLGAAAIGVAACSAYLYLSSSPSALSIRQNHPTVVVIVGCILCMCMFYFLKAILMFVLALLVPIPLWFLHASTRSRNIKNKVVNKLEELGLSGLERTPMSMQDDRSMFRVSSFGFLAGGRLEVTVKRLRVIPEDWSNPSLTLPQIGFVLIRSPHIGSPFRKVTHDSHECYLHAPNITRAKEFVIMEINHLEKEVTLKCSKTQDLIFQSILPRRTRVLQSPNEHSMRKRSPPNDSRLNDISSTIASLVSPLSSAISSPNLGYLAESRDDSVLQIDDGISKQISGQSSPMPSGQPFELFVSKVGGDSLSKSNSLSSAFDPSSVYKSDSNPIPEVRSRNTDPDGRPRNHNRFEACSAKSLPLEIEDLNDTTYASFNFSLQLTHPEQEGFYFLTFHNCKAPISKFDTTLPWVIDADINVIEMNYPDVYLSANLMPLPQLYLSFSMVFFLFGVIWVNFIRQQRDNTLKIHHMMTALVFFKAVALLSRGIYYHFIAVDGSPVEAWAYIFYTTRLLKGALFFITLFLIGSGYNFIKHILNYRDRVLVFVIIFLQLVANLAEIIYDESVEGQTKRVFFHDLVDVVDLACCSAILFPIVSSLKHLREASRTDGKAAINLRKMELFRHFYFTVVCYIYFTRIISYLISVMITFKYFWVTVLMDELATLIFFAVTFHFFQPMANNPYLLISQDDDLEMEDVLFSVKSDGTIYSDTTNEPFSGPRRKNVRELLWILSQTMCSKIVLLFAALLTLMSVIRGNCGQPIAGESLVDNAKNEINAIHNDLHKTQMNAKTFWSGLINRKPDDESNNGTIKPRRMASAIRRAIDRQVKAAKADDVFIPMPGQVALAVQQHKAKRAHPDDLMQMVKGTALSVAEYFTPVLRSSKFKQTGVLTPEEFVAAGDHLIHHCPTWTWSSSSETSHQKSYLPSDKQYLVTKSVPCYKRCKDIDDHDEKVIMTDDGDEEGWVDTFVNSSGLNEAIADMTLSPNERSTTTNSSPPDSTDHKDYDDDDDEAAMDMDKFLSQDLVEDHDDAVARQPEKKCETSSKTQSQLGNETGTEKESNIIATRVYDLNITYDKYYQTPRLWLVGYDEHHKPLTIEKMYEDISQDHRKKTVTMENHPHIGRVMASVHPCRHAEVMKRLISTVEDGGGLALAGCIGMTLIILACSLKQPANWWPAVMVIFYIISPFPIIISRRTFGDGGFGGQSNPAREWAYFITTGIVLSALALPIVMANVGTIHFVSSCLSLASSVFFFGTILVFCLQFQSDDDYSMY